MKLLRIVPAITLFLLFVKNTVAHCPLCTVGAAAAAGGALWLGVEKAVVGLFLGAFAASMGWWLSRLVKKQYVPFQTPGLVLLSFVLTIVPLFPVITQIYPLYISMAGEYGSWLNRTYVLNLSLFTSIMGGTIVSLTPWLSRNLSRLRRGRMVPFQGIILTLGILVVTGIILQLVI